MFTGSDGWTTQTSGTSFFVTGLITAGIAILPILVLILYARHSDATGERRWHAAGGLLVAVPAHLADTATNMLADAGVTVARIGWASEPSDHAVTVR